MRKYIQGILSLRATSDFEKTKSTISEGVSLRGYNLWILVCSSILASIGLDTNSTAIIIGAMLISPLMSPILGVGLSVAIHDKKLLTRSLRNLALTVIISLFASVIYFMLTPLGQVTSEEQARTFPTLLDVLVALFGGIAGIVSISRHDQTNAIPDLAIAPIEMQGNEILKWEVEGKDTAMFIKVYHSGKAVTDSLKNSIDSALKNHHLAKYHIKSMHVNMTKEEVNELSADVSRQMFHQLQLQNMAAEKNNAADTLSYFQLTKEVKAAFTFVDTIYNGWLTLPDSAYRIDTIPTVFYTPKTPITKSQSKQLYNFLLVRFNKDTLVLIENENNINSVNKRLRQKK